MRKTVWLTIIILSLMSFAFSSKIVLTTTFQYAEPKFVITKSSVKGLCFDILSLLNQRLQKQNISIKWDGDFESMSSIVERLKDGKINIFVGMAKFDKILDKLKDTAEFSNYPLYSVRYTLLLQKHIDSNFQDIYSILSNKKIALVKCAKTESIFNNLVNNKKKNPLIVNTVNDAIKLFEDKKIDGIFYNSLSLGYYYNTLESLNLQAKFMNFLPEKYYYYVVFSKKLPENVKNAINAAVKSIVLDGSVDKIIDSMKLNNFATSANHIVLANIDWPPYEWHKGNQWFGFDVDVVNAVFKKMGFKANIEFMNWKRVLEFLKKGIIDGTFSIAATNERKKYLIYSKEPLSTDQIVFVSRKNVNIFNLKKYKIGYMKDYAYNAEIQKHSDLIILPFDSDMALINALKHGIIDIAIADKNVTSYYMSKLKMSKEDYNLTNFLNIYYNLYFAMSSKNSFAPFLLNEFDKTLKEFKKTKEYNNILKKYSISYHDLWR